MTIEKDSIPYLQQILTKPASDEESIKAKEDAIIKLSSLYQKSRSFQELADLLRSCPTLVAQFTKAKTAKIIRKCVDDFEKIPDTTPLQVAVVKELVAWAEESKRLFLKQSLETRLIALLFLN